MCLPDFKEYIQVNEENPIIGYRIWANTKDSPLLKSEYRNYTWKKREGPHEVKESNSGIYAYNNYNYNNYYNYYYYNNYYNNYNYNYYNNYDYISAGIIEQWGKVAIHEGGQRSEFAKIKSLFTMRESDAKGPDEFIRWIKSFNEHIRMIAKEYDCDTIDWQSFIESKEK